MFSADHGKTTVEEEDAMSNEWSLTTTDVDHLVSLKKISVGVSRPQPKTFTNGG
jgi:hypothetical protein